ncbi:serum amyloid A-5 protein-like [Lytechinus variegatus]|uniref:serum amyloid A-5 protein-like n=1 Tax=Lytechinus variegatus TaxID=7654 RepID=UPI001BB1046A|nr:serum amyloid A-5 protein-like [Lytechinus variegatus]XP_041472194.1 serum amyloid A-5 protein-like [Lytechinus variegatus]
MNMSIIVIASLMSGLLVAPSTADWLSSEYYRNCPEHLLEDMREIEASGPQDGGGWFDRGLEAIQGAWDMLRAYSDMRESNFRNSDKYFHARGNYDAAQRGPGGEWAAGVISDARETWQGDVSGRGAEDTAADQEANEWGRNGGHPDRYRPPGLPDRY